MLGRTEPLSPPHHTNVLQMLLRLRGAAGQPVTAGGARRSCPNGPAAAHPRARPLRASATFSRRRRKTELHRGCYARDDPSSGFVPQPPSPRRKREEVSSWGGPRDLRRQDPEPPAVRGEGKGVACRARIGRIGAYESGEGGSLLERWPPGVRARRRVRGPGAQARRRLPAVEAQQDV